MMNYKNTAKAGVLGALGMTVLMVIARALGLTSLNIEMALGSLLTQRVGAVSWILGLMIHLAVGALLAQIYAFGFDFLTERASAGIGAGFGAIHSAFAGLLMFWLGSIHPLMRNNGVIPAPGPFAISYGTLTAVAFIAVHLVYGACVGYWHAMRREVEVHPSEEMPHAA
jgi:hypothetical protein